ncbi:MAG TPA: hypothetical protein VGT81_16710, partial [Casimicrobiaceae bacterium]|nr:hypothetical protein [Casimicrobiaceae bacterium]
MSSVVPPLDSLSAALPRLLPSPPDAGRKASVPPLAGSADALALAQLAVDAAKERRFVAVVCAEAAAAQR